jgi:integrase
VGAADTQSRRHGRSACRHSLSRDDVDGDELARFLEHVRDDRLFALWRLAATTGMRRGELAGLTWCCLDLDAARLSVEQQLIPTRGGCSFAPPKSAHSRRTIALDPEWVEALRRHRDTQLLERLLAGDAYQDHDLVFCDELGGPIRPQRLTKLSRPTARPSASPPGRCTSCATRPRR